MKSYTFEFQDGELCEGYFETDADAQAWVESILENRGYDVCDLVEGDWDADGKNDDGEQCYRMLRRKRRSGLGRHWPAMQSRPLNGAAKLFLGVTTMTSYKQLESFQKVYLDARDSYPTGSPMHDPVVAFEDRGPYGGLMWRLQGRTLCDESTFWYCDLDAFHNFFHEAYSDPAYLPSVEDMSDFAALIRNEQ